jgi:hypothetical protein
MKKYAMGGKAGPDPYEGKTGPFRGSPRTARELGRRDRLAREAMERAEKYAPGMSLDMPDVEIPDEVVKNLGKKPKKMRSGGSVSSASKRADGCAVKGKTRGKMV